MTTAKHPLIEIVRDTLREAGWDDGDDGYGGAERLLGLLAGRGLELGPTRPHDALHAVVVTMPDGGEQVAVRLEDWAVEVDVRSHPSATWTPVGMAGGSFETRDRS